MRTIERFRNAPRGLRIRLMERESKPRYVILTTGKTENIAAYHPVGNDRDHAIRVFDRHVERARAAVA